MPLRSGVPRTSIVVVSRHRPQALALCLAALSRQSHPDYEVVLVADPDSLSVRPDLPLKRVAFDRANISQARNAGLAQAAAGVVLFIDDDAMAFPGWAEAMARPFADAQVLAAAGFTRGPDGVNWQVQAERITASGETRPLPLSEAAALPPEAGQPVSTIGTNCGFRREALTAIGGFDPAFSYHLDESDVNLRMAARFPQGLTAVVPSAQLVHGILAGTGRAGGGVPHDLTAIGRSAAIFAGRHDPAGQGAALQRLRLRQRRRLLRHMLAGRMDPFALRPVMATLEQGIAEGLGPPPPAPLWPADAPPAFLPMPGGGDAAPVLLAGWHWQARRLRARAAAAVAAGRPAMILLLTPGVLPHRLGLVAGGWWEQRGGLWGPSAPGDPALMRLPLAERIPREWRNCGISKELIGGNWPLIQKND